MNFLKRQFDHVMSLLKIPQCLPNIHRTTSNALNWLRKASWSGFVPTYLGLYPVSVSPCLLPSVHHGGLLFLFFVPAVWTLHWLFSSAEYCFSRVFLVFDILTTPSKLAFHSLSHQCVLNCLHSTWHHFSFLVYLFIVCPLYRQI